MEKQRMEEEASVIAKRLRQARTEAGISQKTLGIRAGIDEFSASARVNQYERGKHVPDFLTLEHFGTLLNVPTEYFYARSDKVAGMLILFFKLSERKKANAIAHLKKLGEE